MPARQTGRYDRRQGLTYSEPLDTVITAETPEGIFLELRPAGLTPRFYAYLVDGLIQLTVMYLGATALVLLLRNTGIGLIMVLFFVVEWLYPVAFELGRQGATPGKQVFGLKVVMDSGLPVTPAASLTRNLLRVVDFLPLAYGAAIVSLLLRRDCKRIGDLAAATLVVHQPPPANRLTSSTVVPVAPAHALRPVDQAAVIALAVRAPRLTTTRLDELAALAASVSGDDGKSGPAVTRRVLGVAMWLLGRRS